MRHRTRGENPFRMRSSNRSPNATRAQRRSRSPRPSHRRHDDRKRPASKTSVVTLPFGAPPISKHDLSHYRPMFGLYLDIQKRLILEELSEDELRGRWKSFVGKWNRGELAEGWYDREMLEKARSNPLHGRSPRSSSPRAAPEGADPDSEADEYGPALPRTDLTATRPQAPGATPCPPPSYLQDLQVERETEAAHAAEARNSAIESLRNERRAERRVQKERLDELAPRAEAGTKERQREKKREKADANRSFAASAHDNADVEVKDADLMGGADGVDELKRIKQVEERKRSQRHKRREEKLAARRAEREQRAQSMRKKEEKIMGTLKELAKVRFGGGT